MSIGWYASVLEAGTSSWFRQPALAYFDGEFWPTPVNRH